MMNHQRLVSRMGAGRWLLLLALIGAGLGLLRAQDVSAANEGTVQFAASNYPVSEGGTAFMILRRTGANNGALNVRVTVTQTSPASPSWPLSARSNLPATTLNVTFVGGCSLPCEREIDGGSSGSGIAIGTDLVTQGTVVYTFTITGIDIVDPPGSITPTGTTAATLTVTDVNGPPDFSFSQPNYDVSESGATVTITVNRSGGAGFAQQVDYNTANDVALSDTDYTATSNTLMFTAHCDHH